MLLFTYFFQIDYIASYAILAVILVLILTGDYYSEKVSPFINSIMFSKMHPHFERQKKLDEEVLRNIKNEMKFIGNLSLYL